LHLTHYINQNQIWLSFYAFTNQQFQRRHVFGLTCCPVCSSIHAVRYCYHDILWTAWTVLIKLTE